MLSLVVLMVLGITSIFAQTEKKETFKVAGSCGMCKNRIEKATKSVDGVTSADWDKETKILEVFFDSEQTDIHKIHMAIAKAGHDTEMQKTSDEVYDELPECCKYERLSGKSSCC